MNKLYTILASAILGFVSCVLITIDFGNNVTDEEEQLPSDGQATPPSQQVDEGVAYMWDEA